MARMVFSVLKAILAFLLIAPAVPAQDQLKPPNQYVIKSWHSENGLPQNSITALIQAQDGYLWLGTQDGLVRFNGIEFTVFNNENTPALKSNMISAIHRHPDGSIWVGTEGRGIVLYQEDGFYHLDQADGIPGDLTVTAIKGDEQGNVWIATIGKGLFGKSKNGFERYYSAHDSSIQDILSVHAGQGGRLWIGSRQGLFYRQSGTINRYVGDDRLNSESISAVLEDSKGRLWVGTQGSGLYILQNNHCEKFSGTDGPSDDAILTLFEDSKGNIWVGTRSGAFIINDEQVARLDMETGLSDNEILAISEDMEGCLWLGASYGLNRLYQGQVAILGAQNGLPSDFIRSVYQDSKGDFWIGTHGSGLAWISGDRLRNYSTGNGLPNDVIRCVLEDSRKNVWIGTVNGLSRLYRNQLQTYDTRDGLSNSFIRSLFEDSKGRLWIGTVSGLNYFENGAFHQYHIPGAPSPLVVYSIFEDDEGDIWIGSRFSIIRLNAQGHFFYDSGQGFRGDRVWSIQQDRQKRTWIGTNTGLCLYLNGEFHFFTQKDGLPNNCIYNIIFDQNDNLWLSSNHGIISLPIQNVLDYLAGKTLGLSPETLGLEEGMKSLECNGGTQPAACLSNEGKIYIPTVKGVAIVHPGKKKNNEIAPPVKIEEVRADGKDIYLNEKAVLSPGTRSMEFHYAALSLMAPEKVSYKYRLLGLDREWNQVRNRRDAYYTNLAPGEYSFQVIAANNDGVWNMNGDSFYFYLRPFFYQTALFRILLLVILILFSAAVFQLRVRQLKKREKQLRLLVEARTQELNQTLATVAQTNQELEKANAELERLSLTDSLTHLPNRRNFELIYNQEWKRCIRESHPLTLLMIDIDFFKLYNDTYGHPQGDECLRNVAVVIQRCMSRAGDFVARLGGEEFAVILPNTSTNGAAKLAERIRSAVEESAIHFPVSSINSNVTISIGTATIVPSREIERDILLSAADQALYQAKKLNRNRVFQASL